ncbi:inosine triphosphate pyrophosphatase [Histoplasma capsulatum H143]|uniref:Inosine triphosphate pyrophosphatase n=1 Tax=Ajellomyces capsulatus (strain H143) TaxID=544712 RepID=C6HG90_AJECH|nr:inosine triphosphate pyrophosphatase [Histoplasma capsulatum H143]
MKTINFITGNKNKLAEVQAILGDTIEVQNRAIDVPEIQGSIEEIAKEKCRKAAETWFLEALGHDGLNKLLDPYEDKSIVAVCTFAFSSGPGAEPIIFQGKTEGRMVPARGLAKFGWDPIFEYEGNTFAEMDKDEKNLISHRYKALAKLKQWLAETYP